MRSFIPLSIPNFEGNERKYVDDALNQGWVSTGGAYITRLEQDLARFLRVDNVAACQSGSAAIHLALVDAGVGPEDVVIVPALTFIAAVNPVRYQFATPVFMDCDDSLCMDPDKLEEFLSIECKEENGVLCFRSKPVKAVIVVHIFGNAADMERIVDIAHRYGITVIEDATEALGTAYTAPETSVTGKFAGTIGDYGAFSFNGNKIITTGGGGAVTAKDSRRVDHIRYLSTQAKDDAKFYLHNEVGYNYRMTNLQAALGVAQLEELPEFIRRKNVNYELYKKAFDGYEKAYLKEFREGTDSNRWLYALEMDMDQIKMTPREIVEALEEKGIQTRLVWGLINEQTPYVNEYAFKLEKAPYYASCILNIPSDVSLTEEEIEYVSRNIKEL